MGKKRAAKGPSAPGRGGLTHAVPLREETSGRTHADAPTLLRVQHLQRLAAWAGGEAQVGPLGALLGARLAADAEASGIPLPASTFLCQRCETVLQPGFNCTIRIQKNKKKAKRRNKSSLCQNSVAYACHFCGEQNLRGATAKGVVKSLLLSRKHATIDSNYRLSRADNESTGTVVIKNDLEHHSQVAVLHVESSSGLKHLTTEKDDHRESSKSNPLEDIKMEEKGVASSTAEPSQLTADTSEDYSIHREVVANTNEECMHETNVISPEKIGRCEAVDGIVETELSVQAKFITQRNKLTEVTDLKNPVTPFKTKSMSDKGAKNSCSIAGKAPTSAKKSTPNDSGKNTRPAPNNAAEATNSSRKRSRKGWTTLKQIAEKEELERKERLGNFVIPFFM